VGAPFTRGRHRRDALEFDSDAGDVSAHPSGPLARLVQPRTRSRAALRVPSDTDPVTLDHDLDAQRALIERRIDEERRVAHSARQRAPRRTRAGRAFGNDSPHQQSTVPAESDTIDARGDAMWGFLAKRLARRRRTE